MKILVITSLREVKSLNNFFCFPYLYFFAKIIDLQEYCINFLKILPFLKNQPPMQVLSLKALSH